MRVGVKLQSSEIGGLIIALRKGGKKLRCRTAPIARKDHLKRVGIGPRQIFRRWAPQNVSVRMSNNECGPRRAWSKILYVVWLGGETWWDATGHTYGEGKKMDW